MASRVCLDAAGRRLRSTKTSVSFLALGEHREEIEVLVGKGYCADRVIEQLCDLMGYPLPTGFGGVPARNPAA